MESEWEKEEKRDSDMADEPNNLFTGIIITSWKGHFHWRPWGSKEKIKNVGGRVP